MDMIGQRIKQIRERLNYSQQVFAKMIGIPFRTYTRYEYGEREPSVDALKAISALGKVSIDFLVTGIDESKQAFGLEALSDDYAMIPHYDIQVSAGNGAIVGPEMIIDSLYFKRTWIKQVLRTDPKNLCILDVVGDSMEPTLHCGDTILVNVAQANTGKMRDGIYVFRLDDTISVKRIRPRLDGSLDILSDNSLYPPFHLTQNELSAKIIGRVIWFARTLK